MTKPFRTYNTQLRILRSRGLVISNGSKAKRILEMENYYNVINGYKDLFLQLNCTTETYIQGTSFFEIHALYEFDRDLRHLFLKPILQFENNVKSIIAYEFSSRFPEENYLKISNFDLGTNNRNLKDVSDIIASIQKEVARQILKHNSVTHYVRTYGYIPLWVLVNILTLGTISIFYSYMKLRERQAVAARFSIPERNFSSYLKCVSLFRNMCAHDERLYNYRIKTGIADCHIHSTLAIPRGAQTYSQGKKDLFALLIVLKLVLPKKDFLSLYKELDKGINKLSQSLTAISISDVLNKMGFPSNWKDIKPL